MTFQPREWRPVKELLKRAFPHLPPSTAAKLILLEAAENKGSSGPSVTRGDCQSLAVPPSHPESPEVTRPSPVRAPVGSSERERESDQHQRGDELLRIWKATEPFCLLGDVVGTLSLMQTAFPKVDLVAESANIAMWWQEKEVAKAGRKRKKSERWSIPGISAGIRGWFGRAGKPSLPGQQQSMFSGPVPQSQKQDYTKGVDPKTGRW